MFLAPLLVKQNCVDFPFIRLLKTNKRAQCQYGVLTLRDMDRCRTNVKLLRPQLVPGDLVGTHVNTETKPLMFLLTLKSENIHCLKIL